MPDDQATSLAPIQPPILEFDPANEAMLEPARIFKPRDIPPHLVLCFFQDVIDTLVQQHAARVVARLKSEIGRHLIYEISIQGRRLAICHPGIGAPLGAILLEEIIAIGGRKFIACGGAGVLNSEIAVGHVIIPTTAVRDEGTSYHYLPPAREVSADPAGVVALEAVLRAHEVEYLLAKTWTTDGLYRETPQKVQSRKAEGCLTVEMEAAAFFAVAKFRGVQFAQLLYGGDDLGSESWDHRGWDKHTTVREKLFWLAAEACLKL